MMLKVIARTIGLHRLILLNFYPFLQKYIQVHNLTYPLNVYSLESWVVTVLVSQPHQRDVTSLLAAAVQACHDMVSWLFFPCPSLTFYILKVLVTIAQITYDEWTFPVKFDLLYNEQVPPDAVQPLFKQLVNQFVHDRSRPEVLLHRWYVLVYSL